MQENLRKLVRNKERMIGRERERESVIERERKRVRMRENLIGAVISK